MWLCHCARRRDPLPVRGCSLMAPSPRSACRCSVGALAAPLQALQISASLGRARLAALWGAAAYGCSSARPSPSRATPRAWRCFLVAWNPSSRVPQTAPWRARAPPAVRSATGRTLCPSKAEAACPPPPSVAPTYPGRGRGRAACWLRTGLTRTQRAPGAWASSFALERRGFSCPIWFASFSR